MGNGIIGFYNNRIKKEWKTAFYASLVISMLTHIYKFTNTLPNHDALYNIYCDQNMIGLGRWLLAPACMFSSFFDLPWLTGLLAIFFLSLSVVVLVEIFGIVNPVAIILVSGITVTFPAITESFFYEYTSDGYMLAMLIASCAVLAVKKGRTYVGKILIPLLCVCCSCAIYQAYAAYAAVLLLCYLIFVILTGENTAVELLKWLGRQILIFAAGLLLYYVVWRILLKVEGISVSGYEGIDNVGRVDAGLLASALSQTIKEFVQFFIKWDIRKYGFNTWIVLGILFLMVLAAGIIISVIKTELYKKKILFILLILSLLAIPFAAFMWFFTSYGVVYNIRMEQSLCLLYVLTVVLYDRFASIRPANAAAFLIAVCIMENAVVANIYYHYMNLAYEKGYATAVEVSTRIHMIDDGSAKYIAVIGEIPGFAYEDYKKPSLLGNLGPLYVVDHNLASNNILLPLFLGNYTGFQLAYYTNRGLEVPLYKPVDETAPVSGGWELRFPYVSAAMQKQLEGSEEVKEMGVWPAADSIRQIGDTIVIRFSTPLEQENVE